MTTETMRKIVSEDFETKDLEISDVDLYVVYRYITLRNENYEKDGYRPKLITNPYIEMRMEPTEVKLRQIESDKIKEKLHFFDMTTYVQNASLALFEQKNDERKEAFKMSLEFLKNYSKDFAQKGMYLYGKYGTGKSYLMSAIAIELAKKNVSVLFVYMPDLVRNIKQGIQENNLEQRINQLKQVDVLMIDDIGGEHMTPWFRDEVLTPIIQYRLSTRLPIFMTSNLTFDALTQFLSNAGNQNDMVKAVRLIQRIRQMTNYVSLNETQYKNI